MNDYRNAVHLFSEKIKNLYLANGLKVSLKNNDLFMLKFMGTKSSFLVRNE